MNDDRASVSALGSSAQNQAEAFVTTHWSLVLTAQGEVPVAAQEALELCRIYWWPLYGYVRRQGHSPEEAQDLTQGLIPTAYRPPAFHWGNNL